jgi:hypothetical protein
MPPLRPFARRPLLAVLPTLLLMLLAAPVPPARANALPVGRAALDSLAALIPEGAVTVEMLAPSYSRRTEEIAVRMEAAARHNPAWFQAYTRRYPVSPLPWHPNLGVTREEYQEYLLGSKTAPMAVTQRATLTFEREPARRRWRIHGWGKLQPLDGLLIDLERNTIDGRRGSLPGLGVIAAEAASGSPLAWRWYGVWKAAHRMGDPLHGGQAMSASLHLGPLGDGRSAALYWTYRRYNNGARLNDEFLLLRYPLPR